MTATLGLTPEFRDTCGALFKVNALQYLEDSVSTEAHAAAHLEDRLASFTTETGPLPLRPVADHPFLDLGPENISDTALMTALPAHENQAALQRASAVAGRTFDPDTSALLFITESFVAGSGSEDTSVVVGHAEQLIALQYSGDRVDFVQLSPGGARAKRSRVPSPDQVQTPKWLLEGAASLPPRGALPPAYSDRIVGLNGRGNYAALRIESLGEARLEPERSHGGVRGVVLREARLDAAPEDVIVRAKLKRTASDIPELGFSRQSLDVSLEDGDGGPIIIVKPYPSPPLPPGPPGPPYPWPPPPPRPGTGYGDSSVGCGGRSNPDACLACCDEQQGTGVSMGMAIGTAAGAGAILLGAKTGALVGIWAGPVGVAIGGLVGSIVGCATVLITMRLCYDRCHSLFPIPAYQGRRYQITGVARDSNGHVTGYVGEDDHGERWALSQSDAAQTVAGGMRVTVVDDRGSVPVHAFLRRDVLYLASLRDNRISDNISVLPTVELPEDLGLGLGAT